jgi:hypothetical protein
MEYKDDPDMGKTLQSPERIRLVKGRQNFQERLRFGYQSGLSGNTEFFPKTGMNTPYGGKSEMIQLFFPLYVLKAPFAVDDPQDLFFISYLF